MSAKGISIITTLLENKRFVGEAINSVLGQSHNSLEYIVIDGGSTDGSMDVVHSYGNRISRIISEPDNGIYDALNKGIALASNSIIGFLHSDDFYVHNDVIARIADAFDDQTDAVYADLDYVGKDNGKVIRKWRSGPCHEDAFRNGWMPPHPTFFVRKSIYEKYGGYDTRLRFSADYELMLRLILKHRIRIKYIPEVLVKMRTGGQSNRSILNRIRANNEDRQAWNLNGLEPLPLLRFLKPLRKIGQYRWPVLLS